MNVMQKKYLQILNIHYIQTRGLPGCHHGSSDGDGSDQQDGKSPAVPSIVHAVEDFLAGREFGVWKGGRGAEWKGCLGVKMPIDSSVGHH